MRTYQEMRQRASTQVPKRKIVDEGTLNPKFWDGFDLRPEIQKALEERARGFVRKLGIDPQDMSDIRIVGGNASYNYTDTSDLDVTIMLDRNQTLKKDDVRRLGISAANLTYRLSPSIEGVDLNFYIGHRNLGSLRPAK